MTSCDVIFISRLSVRNLRVRELNNFRDELVRIWFTILLVKSTEIKDFTGDVSFESISEWDDVENTESVEPVASAEEDYSYQDNFIRYDYESRQ